MRAWRSVGVAGLLALGTGCGPIEGIDPPPPACEESGECEAPDAGQSLYPLGEGSVWLYRIVDPVRGDFEKRVEVSGPEPIPGTDLEGTLVVSVQPHLEEHSWQVEADGMTLRAREDDYRDGQLLRQQRWDPHTMKSLTVPREVGWTHSETVEETVEQDGVLETRLRTYVWKVAAVEQTVEVPAGTWSDALRLERLREDEEGWDRAYWLVPGVGKVREEGNRVEELIEYDVR